MALSGYVNVNTEVVYDTEGTQSGLTDLIASIFKEGNTSGTPDYTVTLAEIGASGIYREVFIPLDAGSHVVSVTSAASAPPITNKGGRIFVAEKSEAAIETAILAALSTAEANIIANTDAEILAIKGAGFNPATDTLEAIADAIAAIASTVGTPGARGKVL